MARDCYYCKAPIVKGLCECHKRRAALAKVPMRAITGTWARLSTIGRRRRRQSGGGGRGIHFVDTAGIEVYDRLVITVTGRSGRVRQVDCQVFWFAPGRRRGLARKVTRRERRSMRKSVRKGRHDWCGFAGGCWSRDQPCAAAELIRRNVEARELYDGENS